MAYRGQRKSIPASVYGNALSVMETHGWTWQEYLEQPADLVLEAEIRIRERAKAEKPNG